MAEREVIVLCYWNGCIKYGPDGVYYQGPTPKKISVKQNTEFSRLVEGLYLITGLDKSKSKFDIIGRYPVVCPPNLFKYVHLPVVNDTSLKTMLEVPSIHPSVNIVELYLEVTPACDDIANLAAPLDNPGSSSKRQRTHLSGEADDTNVTHPVVKLERDIGVEVQGVNNSNGAVMDNNSGLDGVAQVVHMTADTCLNEGVSSSASKPRSVSNLWVDDHEFRVGMCFKDRDELKNAVDWCSIRGRQKCVVKETEKDTYVFECIRWKCNWSLCAGRMEEHGLVEITKCSGPHTCCPIEPEKFDLEYVAEEIKCLLRVQPTLTVCELKRWWLEKFGYKLGTAEMKAAKHEAITKIYGDWDQSFRLLPKLMAALHSSNALLVDWQYDRSPNPEFASFCGVFWAFPQSIEGFRHCKPLIMVDSKDLNGKYPMKLMVALGIDADDYYLPLAFAVTKEVSSDSWRWFLSEIRDKVTQREGICLISSPHRDILAVVNEPESRWKEPLAYHRFCLDHLCSQFYDVFQNSRLKSLVSQAGLTIHQDESNSHMETIKKENLEAWRWLDQMPKHQWAFAHDGGRRYGNMTLDTEKYFCENFPSTCLPLTTVTLLLFDELRTCFQEGLSDSYSRLKRGDMYTKPVMDKLEEFRTSSVTYVVMPLDGNAFQVTIPLQKEKWIVQLSGCTCTCGEFQKNKFPCLHALAVCEKLKINPFQYVDNYLSLAQVKRTYSAKFNHVPEVSTWPEASGVPTLLPPIIPSPPPPTCVSDMPKRKTTPRTSQKKS